MPWGPFLDWIDSQRDRMIALVEYWASISSGTYHLAGISRMAEALRAEFGSLAPAAELVTVPPIAQVNPDGEVAWVSLGPVLSLRCRPRARKRVLLAIHYDTVYPETSDFQTLRRDQQYLLGPGVADAKGGIVVLLIALQALERYVLQSGDTTLGWDVLLNADEEIGSPGSCKLFEEAAARNGLGLLYEPALPSGELAGERKGSANFHLVCRGKSAHAGRHFDEGINAIAAASRIAVQIHALNGRWPGATFNVARIDGGGPLNMVPDNAVVRLNVRYSHAAHEAEIASALAEITNLVSAEGVSCLTHGAFTTPPKQIDATTARLLAQVKESGHSLGLELNHRPTGGVCDGNRLAACGLPNVDTLGVRGGGIHSSDEFLVIESLTERARLSAKLLIGWASGELEWPLGTRSIEQPTSQREETS